MNYLAIDCGSEFLSLALCYDSHVENIILKVGSHQTEFVLPEIEKLLKSNKLQLGDLNLICYNQGPASFTGLRIGLSVALSIAYSLDIPMLSVSSFHLYLADYLNRHKTALEQPIYIALDARLSQVYLAHLDSNGNVLTTQAISPEQISCCDDGVLLTNAQDIYSGDWQQQFSQIINVNEYPSASNMFYWVDKLPTVNYAEADLLYVRNKIALNLEEQKLLKR